MAAQYRYGPWGELEHEVASVHNPIRYTGREWDPETGLYFYRARYYDPQVGRFVSEDPIRLAGGINLFAYALNDPVNLRDPSGLCPGCPDRNSRDNPLRLSSVNVMVGPSPCLFAVTAGLYYDHSLGEEVWCEGMAVLFDPQPYRGSSCDIAGCRLREPRPSEVERVMNVLQGIREEPEFCVLVKAAGFEMVNRLLAMWDNFTLNPHGPGQLYGNAPDDYRYGGPVMYLYSRDFGAFTTHVIVHEAVHGVVRRRDQLGQPMYYADGAITPLGTIDQAAQACRP